MTAHPPIVSLHVVPGVLSCRHSPELAAAAVVAVDLLLHRSWQLQLQLFSSSFLSLSHHTSRHSWQLQLQLLSPLSSMVMLFRDAAVTVIQTEFKYDLMTKSIENLKKTCEKCSNQVVTCQDFSYIESPSLDTGSGFSKPQARPKALSGQPCRPGLRLWAGAGTSLTTMQDSLRIPGSFSN